MESFGAIENPASMSHLLWMQLMEGRLKRLFQLALLFSADPNTAESILIRGIETIDTDVPPAQDAACQLDENVAVASIQMCDECAQPELDIPKAASLLPAGLRPLLMLNSVARICFILRFLLGYSVEWCSEKMHVEPGDFTRLLQTATGQLALAGNLDHEFLFMPE